MKRIYRALLIVVCSFPFYLNAQAPGYLGKRAIVGFNFSSFIAFAGPTQNNRGTDAFGDSNGSYGLNYEYEGSFEYVVGRYRSLSIVGGQYYTGDHMEDLLTISKSGPSVNSTRFDSHDLFLRLNVRSLSILLSRYKKKRGGLAPVGNRYYWGFKRNVTTSSIKDKRTYYWDDDLGPLLGHENLNIGEKVYNNYLIMGWSNNQVFWDRILFTTGLRFAIPLNLGNLISDEDLFNNQEIYKKSVSQRLALHELMRINISVGYLLF